MNYVRMWVLHTYLRKLKTFTRDDQKLFFSVWFNGSILVSVPGGKLRGSLGELPKFPGTFLLGMCLLTHGHYVHCWLWRRVCQNHPGPPVYGLLHPWWFGKNPSHSLFPAYNRSMQPIITPHQVSSHSGTGRPSPVVYAEVFLWLTTSPQYVACHVLSQLSTVLQRLSRYNADVFLCYLMTPI